MENLISEHEIRVYEAVRLHSGWLTAKEIAAKADVSDRTSRHHAAALADTGVFDVAKVFGGYRYRIRTALEADAAAYVAEVEAAKPIMA